jgi:hypothetical protein
VNDPVAVHANLNDILKLTVGGLVTVEDQGDLGALAKLAGVTLSVHDDNAVSAHGVEVLK